MTDAGSPSRLRRFIAGLALCVVVLAVFAAAVALFLILLVGIALVVAGLASWVRPVDVASAWARTLGGIGLIGGSAGLGALGWLGIERLAGPLDELARLRSGDRARHSPVDQEGTLRRSRKFIAVVGILLALICLPFAAAIHTTAHEPWLAWGSSSKGK